MKSRDQKKTVVSTETTRLMYYDELHFISPETKKDKRWAAEVLYFNKRNSEPFVDPASYREKLKLDNNQIDSSKYKRIIDPEEGKAEYFSADWKGNPLHIHLNNIVDARIERQRKNIVVKAADEFSKTNQQKENERILGQEAFRNFINGLNKEFGFPPLKKNEDPFSYVERINLDEKQKNSNKDIPTGMIDSIKSAIEDNEDLALFNEYIWKDGVEIACEIGIKHYLHTVNRLKEYYEDILRDIRVSNAWVLRMYTSLTTGLPVLEYLRPDLINISRCKKKDLSDRTHWFIEYDVSFGDFIRMFGANMGKVELAKVFEASKIYHGIKQNFSELSVSRRNSAVIRIGYMEFESQDKEVYTEYESNGNSKFLKTSYNYRPSEDYVAKHKAQRIEKNYNVWRSFYYIPLTVANDIGINSGTIEFAQQAEFIYDFCKIQDQQRYGDDYRYSKDTLLIYKSDRPSWFDIMNAFMPRIHLIWQQVQNELAQAMPTGRVWVEEFLTGIISMSEDTNKDAKALKSEVLSRINQTGTAIAKFYGKQDELVAGGKPFVELTTRNMEAAAQRIVVMMQIYQMMTRALSMSETAEGVDPKSRQSVGGIQIANNASENGTYWMEESFGKVQSQAGEWLLYYFKELVDDGDSERLQDFVDVVGQANGMAMKSIKDIPMHNLGLYIDVMITDEQRAVVNNLASQMAAAGNLDPDMGIFISQIENYKQAYAILRLKIKQKQRENIKAIEADRNFKLQMQQGEMQFEMMKQQANNDALFQIKQMEKTMEMRLAELDAILKTQGQKEVKQETTQGRIKENIVDHQLNT